MKPPVAGLAAALTLLVAASALAAPVSLERARLAATNQLAGSARAGSALDLHAVASAPDGTPRLWLASRALGGFVLLRGDDRLPPVAAWSDSAPAPWPAEHPALQAWLDMQVADVDWAIAQGWTHPQAAPAWATLEAGQTGSREGEVVAPMLESTWDQGWPWNQYCPADGAGPGGHVWAGCVATAMAQIMYFWRWPDYGDGAYSYVHPVYGLQSANFGAASYDWDAMTDSQGTPAAALLQYHCGVAVEMDYAPDGSGAFVGTGQHSALEAFEQNFRYPTRADFITHQQFPGASWATRLTEEILAGRPVLNSGYGSGGHAFVLDGLQDGLFHLNWGWSGWFNGWFDIEALTPGGMNFSIQQGAIVGLERDTAPVVQVADQTIPAGGSFVPIQLDLCGTDAQEEVETLQWWTEENPPLWSEYNSVARTVQVHYPAGWTGTATVNICALDPQGLFGCDEVVFRVVPASLAPAPVADLRVTPLPGGARLDWTLPTLDSSGQFPMTVTGVAVHSTDQWPFTPGAATLRAGLPGTAISWTDPQPVAGRRYYQVVVTAE
jgi:hypothetical protein